MNAPKVLLIRLSSLGDVVLSTAAIAPLRRAGYSVSLVTKAEFASLFLGNSLLDQVYSYDKAIPGGEKAAREAMLSWAQEQGFDFALDLQNSWRTWTWRSALRKKMPVHVLAKPRLREWMVLFLRLGRWIGFGAGGRAELFQKAAETAVVDRKGGLAVSTLAAPLTVLQPTQEEKDKVLRLLPSGDFAVILPASAWRSKEWPYFRELAALMARKVPVVVLGGAKDSVCEEVALAAKAVNAESRTLHGKTTLRESMAVLAHARWVIGNDTGMVHIAEALGKDVAMVEGPTHSFMGFSPYRERSVLLGLDLVCRPCSKSGKICVRFGTRLCLYGLKTADVATRLREKGYPC